METQVFVSPEGGTPVPGRRNTWEADGESWWHIRVPKHAKTNPLFDDYRLPWSLDKRAEGIGCTGWDWEAKRSRWVGFDFDAITGHAVGVGITDEKLEEVKNAATAVPWVEVRKSTSGSGLHLYVLFDGDGIETANHTEHAAVGRAVLAQLSTETGFNFASQVDACGGNMWIFHRKMTRENQGLQLVRAAERPYRSADLPSNWRDHMEVVTRKRAKVRIQGIADEASFESLASSRTAVPLDAKHRAVMEALSESGCSSIWVPDHHLLQTHTAALAKLMDSPETRSRLGLIGFFQTNSPGTDPGQPNCFAFPLPDGAWKVYRFSPGICEAETWTQDGTSWTSCYFNQKPSLGVAATSLGGVERPGNGGYAFTSAQAAVKVAESLGQVISLEERMLSRDAVLKRNKDGRLVMELAKAESDGLLAGWDGTAKKGHWVRVFSVSADPKPSDEIAYDNVVRAIVTTTGEDAGYVVKSAAGTWDFQSPSNAKKVLQFVGCSPSDADCAMGEAVSNRWVRVALPFHPEYPGGRQWNLDAPQFAVAPATIDDDQIPHHPTWDLILSHIGADLDEAVAANEWCQRNLVKSGREWLTYWIASALRFPFDRTPYLCLYGPENTGKSILHEALALLVTKGVVSADRALTNQSNFNGELAGAVFAVVEEVDLSKAPVARNRLKEWVTALTLSIRRMRTDTFHQPNTLHFIQCTNRADHCPILPGDSRIVLCQVLKPTNPIPKYRLLKLLEAEAAQFLATLMHLVMPEPAGRLRVAVIETAGKVAAGKANAPVSQFLDERCVLNPDARMAKSDLFASYFEWCEDNGHAKLSPSDFGKQVLEFTERKVEARGRVLNRQGKRGDAYSGIELALAA